MPPTRGAAFPKSISTAMHSCNILGIHLLHQYQSVQLVVIRDQLGKSNFNTAAERVSVADDFSSELLPRKYDSIYSLVPRRSSIFQTPCQICVCVLHGALKSVLKYLNLQTHSWVSCNNAFIGRWVPRVWIERI